MIPDINVTKCHEVSGTKVCIAVHAVSKNHVCISGITGILAPG